MEYHYETKEENGFSAIEIMLSLIIVILITFVGFYIYHAQKTTDNTYTSSAKVAQSAAPKVAAPIYLSITQWGVKAKTSNAVSLSYMINPSTPNTASFTSSQLKASDPGCTDDNAGGVIMRYLPTDQVVGEIAANAGPDGGTAAQVAATLDKSDYQFINGYYYFVDGPQAACGTSTQSQTLETQTKAAVQTVFQGLKAAQ